MENLSVEVEELSEAERKIKISVPSDLVDQALQKALATVRKTARIKGFRKGKAPSNMIQKLYGPQIESDALKSLLDTSYTQFLSQTDLKIVSRPEISDFNFSKGSPFTYQAKVEILPEIKLKKYKGLKIKVLETPIDPNAVEKEIAKIRESQARLEPITPVRALAEGDFAIVDHEAHVDGKPFPGGAGQGVALEIGSGQLIPGFEEALMGAMPGEEREFAVDYPAPPEDMEANEFTGKKIQFKVKVNEIKCKILPEENDDLARDLGEFTTLAELKDHIDKQIKFNAEQELQRETSNKLTEALIESNPFSVPKAMVEQEIDYLLEDTKRNFQQKGSVFPDDSEILEKLRENFRPQAEKRLQGGLLLEAVAKAEKVEVGDEDVEQYLHKISDMAQKPLEEVRKYYQQDKARSGLKMNLKEEKTLEFLKENAKITKEIRKLREPNLSGEEDVK